MLWDKIKENNNCIAEKAITFALAFALLPVRLHTYQ